ncbi:MAG: putative F0F1-ATPase [Candidatus Latescibacteria bacterium ADurb.Bin168]|nr:MAG: putative F0F1-ATPase [Candidatus Latescibacteria bacterium ADurb.Bin168]
MPKTPGWADSLREVAPLLSLGIQLALIVVVSVIIGRWVDQRYGTGPWGVLIGAVFGTGSGLYHFIRTALGMKDRHGNRPKNDL